VRKSTIAALAFDLVCAGWATFPDVDVKSDKRLPIAMTLRIDLENRRWCQSPCRSTSPIADVSATEIILSASKNEYERISRESGEYWSESRFGKERYYESAKCEVQQFSGFPKLRF
jgi:hypothetical protein